MTAFLGAMFRSHGSHVAVRARARARARALSGVSLWRSQVISKERLTAHGTLVQLAKEITVLSRIRHR